MAYNSNILGIWRFNNNLFDEVNNNNFLQWVSNGVTATVDGEFSTFDKLSFFDNSVSRVSGLGLGSTEYTADVTSALIDPSELSICFWWTQDQPLGFVRHTITFEKEARTLPVIAKADKTVSGGLESISGAATFYIVEKAASATTNKMSISICDSIPFPPVTFETGAYLPGTHHFCLTVSLKNNTAEVYLDGKLSVTSEDIIVVEPCSAGLKLGSINPNYVAHQSSEESVIADLILVDEPMAQEDIVKVMVFGVDYFTDDETSNYQMQSFPIAYSRPCTTETTKILSTGGDVYVYRSNGDILKGEQSIWDNGFDFSSDKKISDLTSFGSVEYSADGCVIQNGFVRI